MGVCEAEERVRDAGRRTARGRLRSPRHPPRGGRVDTGLFPRNVAIHGRMNVGALLCLQLGTHPLRQSRGLPTPVAP